MPTTTNLRHNLTDSKHQTKTSHNRNKPGYPQVTRRSDLLPTASRVLTIVSSPPLPRTVATNHPPRSTTESHQQPRTATGHQANTRSPNKRSHDRGVCRGDGGYVYVLAFFCVVIFVGGSRRQRRVSQGGRWGREGVVRVVFCAAPGRACSRSCVCGTGSNRT